MFVICKQVKKFTEYNLRHIGKALQVFLTNKTVLVEQKKDMWLYSVTRWLGPKLVKLKKAVPWNFKLSQLFIFDSVESHLDS